MGTTATYGFQFPDDEDFVKDGATAMQTLAEAVEAALLVPGVVLQAAAGRDSDQRLKWNTADPLFTRGAWTYGPNEHVIIPPAPGLYMVTVTYGGTGGSTAETVAFIQTKVTSADQSTAFTWAMSSTQSVDVTTDGHPVVAVSSLVVVDDSAGMGVQIEANDLDPAFATQTRISIHQVSR